MPSPQDERLEGGSGVCAPVLMGVNCMALLAWPASGQSSFLRLQKQCLCKERQTLAGGVGNTPRL